jgi:anti-sigma factor RsiW
VSHNNQHLTTEQLSAFLDQQLSPEEQAACNSHLPGCLQCQQEQAELRQTIRLLRALPEPLLPRTFVLPETPSVASVLTKKMLLPAKITLAGRGHNLPLYVRRPLQFMSVLAAVVGIIFILSGLLSALPGASSTMSSKTIGPVAGVHNTSQRTNGPAFGSISPTVVGDPSQVATAAAATEQAFLPTQTSITASQVKSQDATTLQPEANTPVPEVLFFDLNNASGRLGLGLILLLAGFVSSTALRQRSKHR